MTPWITVVGIGDDGLAGLISTARAIIDDAELLVGGERHQAMIADCKAERLTWACGLGEAMAQMEGWRGRRVVVLASGDPMHFGVGATLLRRFAPEDIAIVPHVGTFQMVAARMLWSVADTTAVTLHGRPLETLSLHLAPEACLVLYSRDGETPAAVAALLAERGYGDSPISVFEHLEGPEERRIDGTAATWSHGRVADLNAIALACVAGPDAWVASRVPGLPDDLFEHDGKITKREVRAASLARLMPLPGQLMWDVGAGAGSIAIEWMRAAAGARAIAIEHNADRRASAARNAHALGVPRLQIIDGTAPAVFDDMTDTPDAIFCGGGAATPGVIEACWDRLGLGGRLVANAVTLEGQERLIALRPTLNGELIRFAIERSGPVGGMTAMRPLMTVLQLVATKS